MLLLGLGETCRESGPSNRSQGMPHPNGIWVLNNIGS